MSQLIKLKLTITFISTLIGLTLPILLYILGNGYQNSFSAYHLTPASNYLMSFMLIMSLGFFMGKDTYKVSGMLLVFVTLITVDYPLTHNVLAGLFFLYTAILMLIDKRFYFFSITIFLMSITVPKYGLYPFEIVSVWCISIFNLLYLLRYIRIIKIR